MAWTEVMSVIGPDGAPGSDGSAGSDGRTIHNGSGTPEPELGIDGDFYLNTSGFTIYGPKTAGTWGSPASLQGPTGETGATGATGPSTGAAGGALAGNYPNPTIAANAVTSAEIANNAVGTTEIADGAVTTAKLASGDLVTIENLTPTNGDTLLRVAGAWLNQTMAQLKTALGLVKADVGLGNVDNTSNAVERDATRTLTNARITKRIGTTASSATPTADADAHDQYNVTAAAANMTFGSPTGTPTNGQMLLYRIKDNGTARTIAWNAIFRAIGVTLPTTTVISKTLYVGTVYNSADTKWDVIAVGLEA